MVFALLFYCINFGHTRVCMHTHTAKSDIITIRKGIKIFFGNGEKTGSCSMEF